MKWLSYIIQVPSWLSYEDCSVSNADREKILTQKNAHIFYEIISRSKYHKNVSLKFYLLWYSKISLTKMIVSLTDFSFGGQNSSTISWQRTNVTCSISSVNSRSSENTSATSIFAPVIRLLKRFYTLKQWR